MARLGRELEQLVEFLEKSLGTDKGVVVKSPDLLVDKATGELREVDVSIRGTIGSCPFLIILECRDRKGNEDCTWIEQLATKRDDISAQLAVAVSSSGFSEGAIKKAAQHNIHLRTLDAGGFDDFSEWFGAPFIKVFTDSVKVESIGFLFSTNDEIQRFARHCAAQSATFGSLDITNVNDGKHYKAAEIFEQLNLSEFLRTLPPDKPPVRKKLIAECERILQVESASEGIIPLAQIVFVTMISVSTKLIPFQFQQYKFKETAFADIASVEIMHPAGHSVLLSTVRDNTTGAMYVHTQLKDPK